VTIEATRARCDACGAQADPVASPDLYVAPEGWLHGEISLRDCVGHGGTDHNGRHPFYGHLCAECSGLPVRVLLVRVAQYRGEQQTAQMVKDAQLA
jgi:hypothetical protein